MSSDASIATEPTVSASAAAAADAPARVDADACGPSDADACAPNEPVTAVAIPDDRTLASMAKALGHPARVTILRLLATRETCITGDVVAELPLAQSTVSEHLRILREAGLVQVDQDGTRSAYCISPTGLATLKRGVAAL